jgi:RND family efflux transporter MFP subunit
MRRILAVIAIAVVPILGGCDNPPENARAAAPPPPVTVANPIAKKITEWDEFTGRFEASKQVEVRSRVSGLLELVNFRDGEFVKKGELLYVMDRRPFEVAIEQVKAQIEESRAKLKLAQSDLERARPLLKKRAIPAREFEARQIQVREAEAILAGADARLREAELNLEWTEIRAPIAGRISDTRVDEGNLISGGQASATLLTTIVSVDPIHFIFEGSEADYLKYSRLDRAGQRPSSREVQNPVGIRLADEKEFTHSGKMNFVDNVVDAKSGTIRARAVLDNKESFLTPGMFGRLRLFGGSFDALLLPDSAIASDQASKIVMTVSSEGIVVPKVVELGPLVDGLRVIRSGIKADDTVVIKGVLRARPGQKVTAEKVEIPTGKAATGGGK